MRPEVVTKKGVYVGIRMAGGVLAFQGIRYAQPPVGRLRWQVPQPLPDSSERFDAGSSGPIPIQSDSDERYHGLPRSEDCLSLNIFTTGVQDKPKPVLVWVYGGSYIKGGIARSFFDGDLLVAEYPDVVQVNVNYRLGVFGSLNLSRLDSSGAYRSSCNLARLDLQAALVWIHENIAAFGGDPDDVTLWGHSAGSSNISAQLMIADSRPYFKKAIMHSSFAVDLGVTSWEDSLGAADALWDILGGPTLDELLELPAQTVLEAQEKLLRCGFFDAERKPFGVVLDDIVVPKDAFGQLCRGAAAGIDVILGSACGEYDQQFRPLDMEEKYRFLCSQCGRRAGDLDAVVDFYRHQAPDLPLDEVYMDIKNDLWMRIPANLLASALCRNGSVRIYYNALRKPDGRRAHHGSEHEIIIGRGDPELASPELQAALRQTFLEFVRSGKVLNWPCYDQASRRTLVIAETPYIADGIRVDVMGLLSPRFRESSSL